MRSSRLTTKFRIDAYKKLLSKMAVPLVILKKGDNTAGAILIKVCDLKGGSKLFSEFIGMDGCISWYLFAEGSEVKMDHAVHRQLSIDPDLWVLEIEDREGRHFLQDLYLQR